MKLKDIPPQLASARVVTPAFTGNLDRAKRWMITDVTDITTDVMNCDTCLFIVQLGNFEAKNWILDNWFSVDEMCLSQRAVYNDQYFTDENVTNLLHHLNNRMGNVAFVHSMDRNPESVGSWIPIHTLQCYAEHEADAIMIGMSVLEQRHTPSFVHLPITSF